MDNFNADENIKQLWVVDDRIIGEYLSEELMIDRKDPVSWTPQLRRFFHHNKEIRRLEVLGGGEDIVVLLAKIEGHYYALKVVSLSAMSNSNHKFVSQISCL